MRSLSSNADSDLVKRALAGSQPAYRALVERFERPVMTVILRLVGNLSVAEDLAQETFLKAFRNLERFDCQRRFSSWLFTIAHNTALDHLRRQRMVSIPVAASGEPAPEGDAAVLPAPAAEAPDLAAARNELHGAVESALAELRPAYRQVLLLRFKDGLAYEEIAEVTGQPMGTVKIHLHRGRKQLAARLMAAGFEVPAQPVDKRPPRGGRRSVAETPRVAPA